MKTIYITPGSPWENAYIESFHDKLRDECPACTLALHERDAAHCKDEPARPFEQLMWLACVRTPPGSVASHEAALFRQMLRVALGAMPRADAATIVRQPAWSDKRDDAADKRRGYGDENLRHDPGRREELVY